MNESIKEGEDSRSRVAYGLALAIHEHRLAPGTKLNEDDVGEVYGVSRTVVRAALQGLAHDQLVTLRRNRGAFVAQPSIREAREVFEARALLEPRTARSAAERATQADIERLHGHIEQEHAALDAGDPGRALRLSGQFHVALAEIADQTTILEFVTSLISRSSLVIALYWRRRNALCESHAHHALLSALAAGDADRAEDLMRSHLMDLISNLDLREMSRPALSLKEALGGA